VSNTESTSLSMPSTTDSRNARQQLVYDAKRDAVLHHRSAKTLKENQIEVNRPLDRATAMGKSRYVSRVLRTQRSMTIWMLTAI
jgi:hypothetical protein